MVSLTDRGPPDPVLPLSFVETVIVAEPFWSASGVKMSPSTPLVIAAAVPVTVTEPDPLPVTVRPVVLPSVSDPCATLNVVVREPLPASTSEIAMALPLAPEKTQGGVFIEGLYAGDGLHRGVIDGADADVNRAGRGQCAAGTGVAVVAGL